MCINANIILMIRALINDLDSVSFTDDRLELLAAVAGQYVNQDLETNYTIDILGQDIMPDPVDEHDNIFINLLAVKAACLIDHGNLRMRAALAGLEAKAGFASLKVGGDSFGAYKDIINLGPCGMYVAMLDDYKMGSGSICHFILSPFISNSFDPVNLTFYESDDRYR